MLDLRSALLLNRYRLDGCAVQIPHSPQDHVAKRYRFLDTFCFLYLVASKLADRGVKKQRERLAAFCAVGLQGPLRRAEGKGVKRSDHRERSSQFLPLPKKIKNIVLCFYASMRASTQQKFRIRRTTLAYFSYLCINNSNGGARRYHTVSWLRLYTLHQYR